MLIGRELLVGLLGHENVEMVLDLGVFDRDVLMWLRLSGGNHWCYGYYVGCDIYYMGFLLQVG